MTFFHEKLRSALKRLERTKLLGRVLRSFSLGVISLDKKVQALEQEVYLRHKDLEEHLLATKEYEDLKLYLNFCEIHGTSVATVPPQSALTVKLEDYGPDWPDISERVKQRDGFLCREADSRCRGTLQAHHIISLTRGGTNAEDNLITLCEYHHSLKHAHLKRRL